MRLQHRKLKQHPQVGRSPINVRSRLRLWLPLLLASCGAEPPVRPHGPVVPVASVTVAQKPKADSQSRACVAARAQSGKVVQTPDQVSLWYDLKGAADAPVVVFLHGGPGYNAYAFEKAVGRSLESHFRVLYLDQRGCGRSFEYTGKPSFGMTATINDIAWLQAQLGLPKVHIIAHSFGGPVAVEYVRAHPNHVERLVLVDTAVDLNAAIEHQLDTLRLHLDETSLPQSAKARNILSSQGSSVERLGRLYGVLGRDLIQGVLHFARDDAQQRMEKWDRDSNLLQCTAVAVGTAYTAEGWLTRPVAKPLRLGAKAILFAGRKSSVVGPANIEASRVAWDVPVVWFEQSGHFVYVEEPELFVQEVAAFLEPDGF